MGYPAGQYTDIGALDIVLVIGLSAHIIEDGNDLCKSTRMNRSCRFQFFNYNGRHSSLYPEKRFT